MRETGSAESERANLGIKVKVKGRKSSRYCISGNKSCNIDNAGKLGRRINGEGRVLQSLRPRGTWHRGLRYQINYLANLSNSLKMHLKVFKYPS